MKTESYKKYLRQAISIDNLLVAFRDDENSSNIDKWAEFSIKDEMKCEGLISELEIDAMDLSFSSTIEKIKRNGLDILDEMSQLNLDLFDLELELKENYVVNDQHSFNKYVELQLLTFEDFIDVNFERLQKTKYSVLTLNTILSDQEEETKNNLLTDLPFRIMDPKRIKSIDLAAYFYLLLINHHEKFALEHNAIIQSIRKPESFNLLTIFKNKEGLDACLDLLDHFGIVSDRKYNHGSKATPLFGVIAAIHSHGLFKKSYNGEKALPFFNEHFSTSFTTYSIRRPAALKIKKEAEAFLLNNYKK